MAKKISNRVKTPQNCSSKRGEYQSNTIKERSFCASPQEWRRSSREAGETPGTGEELPTFEEEL